MAEWIPTDQTVNQKYYKEVLEKLSDRVRKKRLQLWRNGWILHQDNALANKALSVKQFLASKNITILEHLPYSPDLAPCDFFLFPKIKSALKGTHFATVKEVKEKTAELLRSLTENDMHKYLEQWKERMQTCVDSNGSYFEGDHH